MKYPYPEGIHTSAEGHAYETFFAWSRAVQEISSDYHYLGLCTCTDQFHEYIQYMDEGRSWSDGQQIPSIWGYIQITLVSWGHK
ncbi:hypothetical protein C0J52_28273 [Blattella germanica]|nr:hypothetical protein C0J52_28273 [Blattella germanica]